MKKWIDLAGIESSYKKLTHGFRSYFLPKDLRNEIQKLHREVVVFRTALLGSISRKGTLADRERAYTQFLVENKEAIKEFCQMQKENIDKILAKSPKLKVELSAIKKQLEFIEGSFDRKSTDGDSLNTKIKFDSKTAAICKTTEAMGGFIIPFNQSRDPLQARRQAKDNRVELSPGDCYGLVMSWRDKVQQYGVLTHYPLIDKKVRAYQTNQRGVDFNEANIAGLWENKEYVAKSILSSMKENKLYKLSLSSSDETHAIGIRKLRGGLIEVCEPNFGIALFKQDAFPFWLTQLSAEYKNKSHFYLTEIGTQPFNAKPCGRPQPANIPELINQFDNYLKARLSESDIRCGINYLLNKISSLEGVDQLKAIYQLRKVINDNHFIGNPPCFKQELLERIDQRVSSNYTAVSREIPSTQNYAYGVKK